MTEEQSSPATVFRYGLAVSQGIIGLFGAGSVIFAAHSLFLRYYQQEWLGVQLSGVNGCGGEEMVANGDLVGGQTLCNKPENFVPWFEIYRHHPLAAATYYGAALAVILIIGFAWSLTQRRRASTTPFGGPAKAIDPSQHEHLR